METQTLWLCRYHSRIPFMREWPRLTEFLNSLESDFDAIKEMFFLGSEFRHEALKMQDVLELKIAKQVSLINESTKRTVKIRNNGSAATITERAKHIVEVFQKRHKVNFGKGEGNGEGTKDNPNTT